MPHITIEHSANLAELVDVGQLVDAVHAAALDDGLAELAGLRTRAVARTHYRIANGNPAFGFVAITTRMAPGRAAADKSRFLTRLIDTADEQLASLWPDHPVALSAEIQEIDAEFRINRNHVRTHLESREDH